MLNKIIIGLIFLISINCPAKIVALIIDKGIDCCSHFEIKSHVNRKNWELPAYNSDLHEGHGTHLAGLILKNTCKEVELQSCIYENDFDECLETALKNPPQVINISAGGFNSNDEEFQLLKKLSDKGVKIIVAAGNEHQNLLFPGNNYYPAKYELKNLIPVGSLNYRGEIARTSNYGLPNEVWEVGTSVFSTLPDGNWGYMSGTSQATAIHTNKILVDFCQKTK